MNYGKKTRGNFIKSVRKEIHHLKKNATKEEIERLDFNSLAPQRSHACIYGQMTGECGSDRAKELFPKSYDELSYGEARVNKDIDCFTALEIFIYEGYDRENHRVTEEERARDNKMIIKFLKGEIKELRKIS